MKNHLVRIDPFWSRILLRTLPAGVLMFCLAAVAQVGGRQQLHGHVPDDIRRLRLQSTGLLPDTNRLNLAIGLPLRNTADLTNLLQQLYDPASPNYRKFLKPAQFAERFGPLQADYDALRQFAITNGLKIVGTHPNRTLLDVNLSVADVRRIFHVNMLVYQHPAEHRAFYAPDAEPSVDLNVSISHVSGLDNYMLPRPAYVQRPPLGGRAQTNQPALGSSPDGGGEYFAKDFRAAYAPGVTLDGRGQTLALFELDGYFLSDILSYEAVGGLPNIPLVNIPVDNFTGPPTPFGDPEVSLDIEMAVDMAPGLDQILVYEEENGGFPIDDILNKIATDDLASQISSSWLIGDDPTYDPIYLQYAAQGQSFFQAAGDNGSFLWSDANQQHTDDPNITLVGGTTLSTRGAGGPYTSETVWNWNVEYNGDGSDDAGGGGISPNYPIPIWQQGINMTNNGGSTTFRNIPDVAMTADNIYVVYEQGESGSFGGTSAAAPLWAAFTSLVNEKAQLTGSAPMGFINPAIYAIAKGPQYNLTFHDITTGNNTNTDDPTNFFAVRGYDLCTGWGSPTGQALIDALVPTSIEVPILTIASNVLSGGNGNGMIDPNECNNLSVTLTNMGNVAATDVQGTLISLTPDVYIGQSISSYGNIPPGGSAINQTTFTVSTPPEFVCGTPVRLALIVKSDQITQTNFLQFATGVLGPPVQFSNPTFTTIPSDGSSVSVPVTVSNITSVGKVTVSVYLTALEDEFMLLQLIGPDGTTSILALDDGGAGANFGQGCSSNLSTIFDDAAPQSINVGVAPLVGTFSPVTPLSVFNLATGTNVNGTWQLNVLDELIGGTAALQCWSLSIYPEQCADGGGQCPGSDLSVSMVANPSSVSVGGTVTYTLSVSNAGPSTARNVVVNQTLPAGVQYIGSSTTQGSSSPSGSGVAFSLGTLGVLSNATLTLQGVATEIGLFTSTATVGSPGPDPNPNNNTASASILVSKPAADLAVTMSAIPLSVPVNGQVTFTMGVTNLGPSTAIGVTLTNLIPPNTTLVSSSTTQGTVSSSGTLAFIGSLPIGSGAQVVLVLSPNVVGSSTLTSVVGLDPSEFDPVTRNNTASETITVIPAADLGVSAYATPSPAISGGTVTYVVTVTNAGPNPATQVVMRQVLPVGATFKSTSQTNATLANGTITWNIALMPSQTSQILTNVVTATNLLTGVTSNLMVSTLTVSGQPGDPQTNDNTLVLETLVFRPMAIINPAGASLTSESFQPPDGSVHPGETVGVRFTLQNVGNIPTTNLVATLQTNAGVVPIGLQSSSYGALAPGGGLTNGQFYFTANSTNGGTVVATLQLQDGPTNLGTASFTFVMPVVTTFWQNETIYIPGLQYTNIGSGPANPFPSSNLVSGVTSYVSDVAVTVSNLLHAFPSDIELLLVGPGGQKSILMSDAAQETTMLSPATLTFDQLAASPVESNQSLATGSFQPAEYNTPVFTNGPLGPFTANLGVFVGEPANGWWDLYAYDMVNGDVGRISNGWALTFTTITPVNQLAALGVAMTAAPSNVVVGGNVTFTITVTNSGVNAATVLLTNLLPAGLSFVSSPIAPIPPSGSVNTYNLGVIAAQSNLTFNIVASATNLGTLTSTASIFTPLTEPNTNNNTASATVTVSLPVADLAAGISATSGSNPVVADSTVVIGSNVVYTLTVTNNGPNEASNVVGVLNQRGASFNISVFSTNFGSLAPGGTAIATFATAAQTAGYLTNTWSLSTTSDDTNAANNSASLIISNSVPAPIIVANGVRLVHESFSPPNGAIDSNETVTVSFSLANVGVVSTTNLVATLQNMSGVTPITISQNYGAIAPGASASASFQFIGRGSPGATISAVLSLTDNTYPLGSLTNNFTIPYTVSGSNTGLIVIPSIGAATPYPAGISVSATGLVTKVTATLNGFTHTFASDVNVLLTSPTGQQVVLMGHVGGPYSVTNLVLTFDGAASNVLSEGPLASGTYLPTEGGAFGAFPAISGIPNNTNLAVFDGFNPNGVWSLYVYDDNAGNSGSIANGWSLNLSVANTVNPSGELAVSMSHAPDPVLTGNLLAFDITVTNLGLAVANSVILNDILPPNVNLVSAGSSQGTVNTNIPGTVLYSVGTLAGLGGSATASIVVEPRQNGLIVNSATASNPLGYVWAGDTASNAVTVNNLALFNLSAAALPNSVMVTLSTSGGQTGQSYIIQYSTNLAAWQNIATNVATSGPNGFTGFSVTNNLGGGVQFYRAVHLPQ